jgi:outer membrane protein TolC
MIIEYYQIPKLVESTLEVKTGQEMLGSSKLRVGSIIKSFVPEVSLYAKKTSMVHEHSEIPSAGVFANINLFNGFRDVEQNKINKLNYEVNNLEFKKSYNDIVFIAKNDFLQAVKIQENLKILNEYALINKNNRNLILKKVSSGVSPRSEEFIFKKIELELQEEILKAGNELKLIYSNIKKLFSINKNESIELNASLDISKYKYDSNAKKIDIAQVDFTEALLQSEKKMSNLWRMPRVNLYAEHAFTNHKDGEILEEDDSAKHLVGIKITLPLLSEKNIDSIEEQVRKRELTAASLRKQTKIRDRENIEDKLEINLAHLLEIIEISKNKVDLSKEILDKTFSEFRIGLKEALSLNEATFDYVQAKKDLIEHQVDYILAIEQAKVNVLD